MIGRDRLAESGNPGSASPTSSSSSSRDNELMGQATRCVRKFAPNGQKRMQRTDNGHITACKISDAYPNEIIVSWSGDHIYSFDLIRSPDATESGSSRTGSGLKAGGNSKTRDSRDRKRKRKVPNSSGSMDEDERNFRSRQTSDFGEERSDLSLRVRYENGQSEDITMGDDVTSISRSAAEEPMEPPLTESQKRALRISRSVAKIQALMFSFDAHSRELIASGDRDYRAYATTFTSILGLAAPYITEMDNINRAWRYPMDPDEDEVIYQRTLRRNRSLSREFLQAAGTLARILGGKLQTVGRGPSAALQNFDQIVPAPGALEMASRTQIYSLEFLRAIVLWLQGGTPALLQGFKRPENRRPGDDRFPVPDEADSSGIDEHIIPYLLRWAQNHPVPNIDASRFEVDDNRKIFENETAAVTAFSQAIRTVDLSEATIPATSGADEGALHSTEEKRTALNFWGFKVGRSLLLKAGTDIDFQFVDEAFGGLGRTQFREGRSQDDINVDKMEDVVEAINLMQPSSTGNEVSSVQNQQSSAGNEPSSTENEGSTTPVVRIVPDHGASSSVSTSRESTAGDNHPIFETDREVVLMEGLHNELADQEVDDYHEGEDEDEYEGDEGNYDDEDDDDDDDDDDVTQEDRRLLFRSASDRGRLRESVEKYVPCSSHHRQYRGHCNVKTVKDVNYFGLQDEYVVSGSDSGHVFIWDKKTSELVNILEGDEEVVNVVQGLSILLFALVEAGSVILPYD